MDGTRTGASANSRSRCSLSRESLVFEKTAAGQNFDELILDLAHLEFAGGFDEHGAQIELRLLPVETRKALDQRRRNNQYRIGVSGKNRGSAGRAGLRPAMA